MLRLSSNRILAPLALGLAAGIASCSGQHGIAPSVLPDTAQSAARVTSAAATPPVTAPVSIPYPYTENFTTTTWSGPNAKPVVSTGVDDGLITVKFFLDKKTGVYDVPESIKSKAGYTELLNSAISFPPNYKGGTAQIILSDNYSYVQGNLIETGMDTYPQGQDSINFPLTTNRRWSAAAAHLSYYNVAQSGKGAFAENVSTNEAANGTYSSQTSFSSTMGGANQDNFASTATVSSNGTSAYTLSQRAAGFNLMTQTFSLPAASGIAVTTSGKNPIPGKAGTVKVKNWYPNNGVLPQNLYADNWRVAGSATMPSDCGKRKGQPSTKVVENSYTLDPVQGLYNTYTAVYYMTSLAKNQFWFACIVENYTNTTYANGWIMNAGSWGTPSSQQVGKEILLATGAKPAQDALRSVSALHVLQFVTPVALHNRLEALGVNHSQSR